MSNSTIASVLGWRTPGGVAVEWVQVTTSPVLSERSKVSSCGSPHSGQRGCVGYET
jgi:hypothetical protein